VETAFEAPEKATRNKRPAVGLGKRRQFMRGLSVSVRAVTCAGLLLLIALSSSTAQDQRFALVVGNAAYSGEAALKNPVNDAKDMAAALARIGWNVVLVTDADRKSLNKAIFVFRDSLASHEGADALFYYAGHGMQIDGANYLLPVGEDYASLDDVRADAIGIQSVTDAIEQGKAGVSLMILDACRDNPFAKKMSRSLVGTRGLTVVQKGGGVSGSAIIFSTSPGDASLDGSGRNGIFTAALLKNIDGDLKIEDLFKRVTSEVKSSTGGAQSPWINASLSSDFYLVSEAIRSTRAAEAAKAAEAQRQAELATAAETARAAEAAKTAAAQQEAEAAKAQAEAAKAQAAAAQAAVAAEAVKPKGKARIESSLAGQVYLGQELLGAVGPDTPLIADSLPTGDQSFRFARVGMPDEAKAATITDKAYISSRY
jgi:uncharacterized caspase-like protein